MNDLIKNLLSDKKKLLILGGIVLGVILVIVTILLIIPKEEGEPNNNNGSNNVVTKNVKLQYWGLWEPKETMEELIEEYEKQNPGVSIDYIQKTFLQYEENTYTRISQTATENTPTPDIIRMNNTWLPKYQPYLSSVPSNIYSSSEYSETFYPTAVSDFTGNDGELYAIPLEIDGLVLFYNKEILSEAGYDSPPSDWDSFTELAKEITVIEEDGSISQSGVAMGAAKNINHSVDILNLIMLQNGVNLNSNYDGKVDLTSDNATLALQFYVDFVTVHKTWSPESRTDLDMFIQGDLGMMFAPSWRAFDILNSGSKVEFGIAPVPQIPSNDPIAYSMYWGEAVPKGSKNQQEAWKFIKFLSEKENQLTLFNNQSEIRTFGEPFSRKDLSSTAENNPYLSPIVEMSPYFKSWHMGDQIYIEEELRTAIYVVSESDASITLTLSETEKNINNKLGNYYNE